MCAQSGDLGGEWWLSKVVQVGIYEFGRGGMSKQSVLGAGACSFLPRSIVLGWWRYKVVIAGSLFVLNLADWQY